MRPRFADRLTEGQLSEPELIDEALVTLGLFQRVEVLTLEVFHQPRGHCLTIVKVPNQDRYFV